MDQKTLGRWWAQLNCWEWPDDLPKPYGGDEEQAIRGAFAVVDALVTGAARSAAWDERMTANA